MDNRILSQLRKRDKPNLKKKLIVFGLAFSSAASVYGAYKLFNNEPKELMELDGRLMTGYAGANDLIRYGISTIENSGVSYEQETYLEMFKIIRDKAEETPEIMAYFGPIARGYLINNKDNESKNREFYEFGRERIDDLKSFAKNKLEEMLE